MRKTLFTFIFLSIFFLFGTSFLRYSLGFLSYPKSVFAGSIGGEPGEECGGQGLPSCGQGDPPGEPTPPGGGDIPTSTPGPTNTPEPPTSTPALPTETPSPPTNTPTPIPPTATPNLSPCPGPNPCTNPTPTITTFIACFNECDPSQINQCGPNRICSLVEGKYRCQSGACVFAAANPQECTCPQCPDCEALSCEDLSTNPGKVIVIPGLTAPPPPNPVLKCTQCEHYYVNGVEKDCNDLLTPQPQEFKQADGQSCKSYTIQVETNGQTCGCTKQVCCPNCEPPKVVPGYEDGCAACDFETQVGGNSAMCPCSSAEISFQLSQTGCVDFGNGQRQCGGPGNPPKMTYGNAGFYDITYTCQVPGDGEQVCKKEIVVGCDCQNMNPTGSPTPSPTLGPWFKLKDASYSRQTNLVNLIPDPAQSFDNGVEDLVCHDTRMPDYRCMLSREAGAEIVAGSIDLNGAPVSHRGWKQENGNVTLDMSPDEFLEYVKAKKPYKVITKTDLDNFIPDVTLTSDKVYIFDDPDNPTITLNEDSFQGQTQPFVLIIKANVKVESNIDSLESVSAAFIITENLGLSTNVSQLDGIFFSNTLDFTLDTPVFPNPLKIKGNMISYHSTDTMSKRINSPVNKPGIFVIFDIDRHLDLWSLLTTKNAAQQEEIQ